MRKVTKAQLNHYAADTRVPFVLRQQFAGMWQNTRQHDWNQMSRFKSGRDILWPGLLVRRSAQMFKTLNELSVFGRTTNYRGKLMLIK